MYAGSDKDEAKKILYYTFLAVGAVGVMLFTLLRKEVSEAEKREQEGHAILDDAEDIKQILPTNDNSRELARTTLVQLGQVLLLLTDKRMMLMVPIMFYSGT